MRKLRIAVYAICKNEAAFIDRWMDSVSEADLVVAVDTGSEDDSVTRLLARGAQVYTESITPWRFDEARNRALSHVPEDVDLCVSNDIDEVFEKGWREKLEAAWQPGYTRIRYAFAWQHDGDGRVIKQFPMEKIHIRKGYRWVHPVHEVLIYDGTEKTLHLPDLLLHHYPDLTKPRAHYLPLLELSHQETPGDDRTAFWLGREYLYHRRYDEAIQTLSVYLAMPTAVWHEERSAAMRYLGQCYAAKADQIQAKSWFYRAIAQCPQVREPYLTFCKYANQWQEWPLTLAMALEGLRLGQETGSYLQETEAWGFALHDFAAIAFDRLGNKRAAYEHARAASELAPENERLRANAEMLSLAAGVNG